MHEGNGRIVGGSRCADHCHFKLCGNKLVVSGRDDSHICMGDYKLTIEYNQ